jgi:DUF1680 family protein
MTFAKFEEVELTSIHPEGWLRRYLEVQRDGLTGHLEVAGYPFDGDGWCCQGKPGKQGDAWWPYEQTGYWIDGMIRCGYLLGDKFLIEKARRHVEYVLDNADPDGYLGPKFMRKFDTNNRWPHAVFFRAMHAYYSATADKRVPQALARHYLNKNDACPHSFAREVTNIESMLWAARQTGRQELVKKAQAAYAGFNERHPESDMTLKNLLSSKIATEHGVSFNEMAKLGALLYIHTGDRNCLDATVNGYRKIDRDHMLIDGVCSSTEGLAGKDPLASHETCDIADYTWAVGYLLMATGDARYADKIERAVFNAAPGAVKSDDFKALQYFSCPNQVVASNTSNHNLFFRGSNWMSYRPNPFVQCCPGEVNRIMPNYASRMWMSDGKGGVVAALFGPSTFTARVGKSGQEVTLVEETNYPFSETVDFQVRTSKPVRFKLHVRIPAWCRKPLLTVNGQPYKGRCKSGTFVTLDREFAHNDRISLCLPMELRLSRWSGGGIGIERGPLVFALKIDEDWQVDHKLKCTPEFPAWNVYPASDWNYALCVDENRLDSQVQVIHHPLKSHPWSAAAAPIELCVPARKVAGWRLIRTKRVFRQDNVTHPGKGMVNFYMKGDFVLTPDLPAPETLSRRLSQKEEIVTLIPYGCTQLRVSIFPQGTKQRSVRRQ